MANPNPSAPPQPLYPQIHQSPPATSSPSPPSLYPSIDPSDLAPAPLPESPTAAGDATEETLLSIPGAILHLIDKRRSVELATGTLSLLRLRHGPNLLAILARIDPVGPNSSGGPTSVQWPLTRDAAAVKLNHSHYFFSLSLPDDPADLLNYGLTFASKGQDTPLHHLDSLLATYCNFSEQKVNTFDSEVLDGSVAEEVAPAQMAEKGRMMEEQSAAYWTALAPNVEDYSGLMAKGIAVGSGHLVKGILWCGDVAVERIRWGDELLRKRLGPNDKPADVSKETLERIKRYFTH